MRSSSSPSFWCRRSRWRRRFAGPKTLRGPMASTSCWFDYGRSLLVTPFERGFTGTGHGVRSAWLELSSTCATCASRTLDLQHQIAQLRLERAAHCRGCTRRPAAGARARLSPALRDDHRRRAGDRRFRDRPGPPAGTRQGLARRAQAGHGRDYARRHCGQAARRGPRDLAAAAAFRPKLVGARACCSSRHASAPSCMARPPAGWSSQTSPPTRASTRAKPC